MQQHVAIRMRISRNLCQIKLTFMFEEVIERCTLMLKVQRKSKEILYALKPLH